MAAWATPVGEFSNSGAGMDLHSFGQSSIDALPISSFRGPDVWAPWQDAVPQTLDQQLGNATQRFQGLNHSRKIDEEDLQIARPAEPPRPRSAAMRPSQRQESRQEAARAQQNLRLLQDARMVELQSFLVRAAAAEAIEDQKRSAEANSKIYGQAEDTAREGSQRAILRQLNSNLSMLVERVKMACDASAKERLLTDVFEWYKYNLSALHKELLADEDLLPSDANHWLGKSTAGPSTLPGSAFYSPPEGDCGDLRRRQMSPLETEAQSQAFDMSTVAALPPAKERLRDFETHRIAGPLTARKLKAADSGGRDLPTPEPYERPFTPSTASGGRYTSRTITSARSTPTPTFGGSRPGSAMSFYGGRPLSSRSGRGGVLEPTASPARQGAVAGFRPASAAATSVSAHRGVPSLHVAGQLPVQMEEPGRQVADLEDLIDAEVYPSNAAELRMEERWLARRNREVAEKITGEDQKDSVAVWAERRARVEEEISRNTEAARFQSSLSRRGYTMPSDARVDIEPTDAAEEAALPPGVQAQVKLCYPPERQVSNAPRFDVTHKEPPKTAFQRAVSQPPLTARIAHLRKIHANLIKFESEASEDEVLKPGDFFMSSEGQHHTSLSAYTPDQASMQDADKMRKPRMQDDVDALIEVCDWWQAKHGSKPPTCADSDITFDEIRFRQLKEVEEIKRVFAKRNCPLNVAVLERALVMPLHTVKATVKGEVFNEMPNLTRNPFLQKKVAGKKKKGNSSSKGKGKAKDKSAPGAPAKSKSPKPKKKES